MKNFFTQNSILTGLVAGLGSMLGFCVVLVAGLLIAGEPLAAHPRWFAGMFIPLLLLLRYYAKRKEQPTVTKTLATLFFVTFIAFMYFMFSTHQISLK